MLVHTHLQRKLRLWDRYGGIITVFNSVVEVSTNHLKQVGGAQFACNNVKQQLLISIINANLMRK